MLFDHFSVVFIAVLYWMCLLLSFLMERSSKSSTSHIFCI